LRRLPRRFAAFSRDKSRRYNFRRIGVDSLLLNAAFRRIYAAHPGIVPALSEFGWRPAAAATSMLFCAFAMAACAINRAATKHCTYRSGAIYRAKQTAPGVQAGVLAAFAAPSAEGRPGRAAWMRREGGMSHGWRIRVVRTA